MNELPRFQVGFSRVTGSGRGIVYCDPAGLARGDRVVLWDDDADEFVATVESVAERGFTFAIEGWGSG